MTDEEPTTEETRDAIRRRLDRYAATGDPAALWPGITEADHRLALERLAAAVRTVLARPGSPPGLTASPLAAATLGVAGFVTGLGPLVGHWIGGGGLTAEPGVADVFARHLEHGRRRMQYLRDRVAPVLDALDRRGVTVAVLKGLHLALDYYPEPGARPAADIDLLVSPSQYQPARAVLVELGFRERSSTPQRSDWAPPGPLAAVRSLDLTHAENPWTVDLHQSLDRSFRGIVAGLGAPVSSQLEPWSAGGGGTTVLRQPLRLAYLAIHASAHLDHPQLIRLVDLFLVIRRDLAAGALRWSELLELLQRTGSSRFAFPALSLTEAWLPGTVPPEVLATLEQSAPRRLRRVVAAIAPDALPWSQRGALESKLAWACGPAELVRTAWDLLLGISALDASRVTWQRRWTLVRSGRLSWRSRSGPAR